MSIIMGVGALLLILAMLGRQLWLNGQHHGLTENMDAAYGHGTLDGLRIGDARGYTRGYSQALLEHVLAQARSDDFTEALLSGALHEPVGEEMASLLAAVQEHERAARNEAAR